MPDAPYAATDDWPELKTAFGGMIAAARRLKPRLAAFDDDAFRELGEISGRLSAEAGLTLEEGSHYMHRILAMVLAEPQA